MPVLEAAKFGISIDGVQIGTFSELQGITTQVQTVEYARQTLDRLALPTTRDRRSKVLLFIRPRSTDQKLLMWHRAGIGRLPNARKNAVLTLFSEGGTQQSKPVARYHLEAAWPSVIEPQAPTKGNAVAMEKVTIAYESIDRL